MIKFRFWNFWSLNQWGDFRFTLFEIDHTADMDFWAWKIVICNLVFVWVRKSKDCD